MRKCFNLENSFKNPSSVLYREYRHQLYAALTINLLTFAHGIAIGWVSPTLNQLKSHNSPVNFRVNVHEASWIGSLQGLGSVIGNILGGIFLNTIGRKMCMHLIAFPHAINWLLIFFAQSVEYLYVARFLSGLTSGSFYVIFPIFISEIAGNNIRGTLAAFMMLSINFGVLCGFIMGSYLSFYVMPLIVVILPISFFCLTFLFPDTPQYLLKQDDVISAEKSYKFYKNFNYNENDENEKQKCSNGFQILLQFSENARKGGNLNYKDFFNKNALVAFLTAFIIMSINQFSGLFSFINYMSSIFSMSGLSIEPNNGVIVIGFVQILGSYGGTLLVDRYGRKIVFLSSIACTGFGLILFGLFTDLQSNWNLSELNWMPLILMAFITFAGNFGIVALTFIIIVEIFPAKIRPIATSISLTVMSFLVFVALKIFPIYLAAFGISITMWSCALVGCLPGFIYLLIFLPETKGKSMDTN